MGIFDLRIVKFKVGAEFASLQFVLDPYVAFGVGVAEGLIAVVNNVGALDVGASTTTESIGGFANVRVIKDLIIGGGANYTTLVDLTRNITTGLADYDTHVQSFGAIQYRL